MSTWSYIRGWVELTEEMIPILYQTIEASVGDAVRFGITEREAESCNEGWVIPEEPRVFIYYTFYGRDVRRHTVPFVQHQMELIAGIVTRDEDDGREERPFGIIHVDEEEGIIPSSRRWELKDGRLHEHLRPSSPRSMRFFTRDWAEGVLPDEVAEVIPAAYLRHLDALALPPALAALVGLNAHDARVLDVEHDAAQSFLALRLRCGDLQRGYTDAHIRYSKARVDTASLAVLRSARHEVRAEVLYDEVDRDGALYVHRLLLWRSGEAAITFEDVTVDVVPAASREAD